MRTTWERWDLDDMIDAAEAEGHQGLDSRPVPMLDFVETLPYFGAFDDFRWHVTNCPACLHDDRPDCATGVAMANVSRIGMAEQKRIALNN